MRPTWKAKALTLLVSMLAITGLLSAVGPDNGITERVFARKVRGLVNASIRRALEDLGLRPAHSSRSKNR